MNVAVLTMTRDRLSYTRHCFAMLQELAGCDYDHYVLDQGSVDGTQEWLQQAPVTSISLPDNIGCCPGWNTLLQICHYQEYDVIVCFDNDCELIQPDTLEVVAGLAAEHEAILSPRVMGLRYPVPAIGEFSLGSHTIEETAILGNIFMAIPARLFDEFRFDETNLPWAGGEAITSWWRSRGGRCGYVQGFQVNHYETTDGQHERYPSYFARRVAEGAPD